MREFIPSSEDPVLLIRCVILVILNKSEEKYYSFDNFLT